MADLTTKRINDLDPLPNVTFTDEVLVVDTAEDTYQLPLEDFREALLEDAALTGTSTAPTPAPGTNNSQVATTEFVQTELAGAGLNPATPSDYGTVRTNALSSTPTVYLTGEIDDMVAALDADILGLEGVNTTQNGRLTTLETSSGTYNTRITTLEGVNSAARLTALEAINAGSRLTAVEGVNTTQNGRLTALETFQTSQNNLNGVVQAGWTNMTAPANTSTTQFLSAPLSFSGGSIPGWTSSAYFDNGVIAVPVAGSYIITANVQVGTFTGTTPPNIYRFAIMRRAGIAGTFVDAEYGTLYTGSLPNTFHGTLSVPLTLAVGDAIRVGVSCNQGTGTINVPGLRIFITRVL